MWRSVLREYFAFPKKERKGIFVLLIIWLILIAYHLVSSDNLSQSNWSYFVLEDVKNLNEHERANTSAIVNFMPKSKYVDESNFKELYALGLTSKTSAIIMKFVKSGASVRRYSTMEKIFSITEKELKILSDNFLFDKIEEKNYIKELGFVQRQFKQQYIDINSADTIEIEALKGIGWKLSKRIFSYREKLGGFVRKEQLLEVYGVDSVLYNSIESRISVDTNAVKKININSCSLDELSKFPYIGRNLARVIINYRDQHGDFKDINDLLKIKVLNSEQVQKFEPYLKY